MRYNRELAVGAVAGLLITFAAWAWGGVVLWTQWVTAGLGLFALVIALLPSTREKWQSRTLRWKLSVSLLGGLVVLFFSLVRRLLELSDVRAATLQLIPNAELPSLTFKDWGETSLLLGISTSLFLALLTGLSRPSGARHRLMRFWPFWLGLFLFAWIICQSLNPWGKVIQRDLFWSIVPQNHVGWLPSGLEAPFGSTEEPPGMNGWRQLLILVGPWALLCALCIAVNRQRVFAWLAGVASFNAVAVLISAHATLRSKSLSFLGFQPEWAYHSPFGPFVYRNHGGIYLYVMAGLAAALTFYLILRRGERSELGGPHLITGLLFIALCAGAVSTQSVGASLASGLIIAAAILAYCRDMKIRQLVSPSAGAILAVFAAVLFASIGRYTFFSESSKRLGGKIESVAAQGVDNRAPLRRAATEQIASGTMQQLVGGWGAGSYRWTAPAFLVRQPEFSNAKGELMARANYAHCDWLQMLIEWGFAGLVVTLSALVWVGSLMAHAMINRCASATVLASIAALLCLHAVFDFIFYFTALLVPAALCVAWLRLAVRREVSTPNLAQLHGQGGV